MSHAYNHSLLTILPVAVCLCLLIACPVQADQQPGDDKTVTALTDVLAGTHRAESDRARDQYRHPLETLTWFGIRDNMTVVEIWPGGGWYTDILAPFLKERGVYYAVAAENEQSFKEKLAAAPLLYGKVMVTELVPPAKMDLAPEGSADMVLTFRNIHNWMNRGYADEVFKAMYRALKPGGVLGIVEHRGNPTLPQDPKAASGYVTEDQVIKLAEAANFQLVARSEINANPKDTKDYPKGVWTLPPVLRMENVDREKYLAIGESDRMTLKFIKPVTK
ncbi:MAG: class I SAM-dependent methyltransferase [Deltaproteobacteria bacterium]|nr:class I SAM-dependent methyltransferase [Deltaproteobacteria bacterium]